MIWKSKDPITFETAMIAAAFVWNLGRDEILSPSRKEPLAAQRAILIVSVSERSRMSAGAVGGLFNRHGNNVGHILRSHKGRMEVDREYKENYLAIQDWIDNVKT
jgi:hypothetical protein